MIRNIVVKFNDKATSPAKLVNISNSFAALLTEKEQVSEDERGGIEKKMKNKTTADGANTSQNQSHKEVSEASIWQELGKSVPPSKIVDINIQEDEEKKNDTQSHSATQVTHATCKQILYQQREEENNKK